MTENANPETPPEPAKQPTLADIQAIAEEASKTAAEAKSKAEALEGVQTTVETEAEKQGVALSEEDCKKIADATIAGLEARGAFEEEVEETVPPTPAPGVDTSTPASTTPAPSSTASPTAPTAGQDSGPKKRTIAERFVGRK
jgi:hypothetical protein